ncbi:hypothetical protein OG689_25995 [Kitasatospora sp. NBC_00240]|uniref:hypothetical protein n=1 Tax=Kitasatospora sp. NBC_00240 TaxID=2903567 RepID=UPI002254B1FF|nr:hypothetical protein [Kitasatospora sp. NBC_00240]MCX5212694.1 hypothetical protein [Kitasatospora sp. NBC_00240]
MFRPQLRVPVSVSAFVSLFALVLVAAVAAVMLAAPARAEGSTGPKNPQEAAICSSLLSWVLPGGSGASSVDALCAVQGSGS